MNRNPVRQRKPGLFALAILTLLGVLVTGFAQSQIQSKPVYTVTHTGYQR